MLQRELHHGGAVSHMTLPGHVMGSPHPSFFPPFIFGNNTTKANRVHCGSLKLGMQGLLFFYFGYSMAIH